MKDLLLFRIDGQRYGIWKEDVEAVRELQSLHRLPLSPACIAGISILDGSTVTLADLTVCIGNAGEPGKEDGRILLMPGSEKPLGFMVGGGIETLSVAPDSVFPLPQYLSTPVIDSCLVHGDAAVPLINIAELVSRFRRGEQESPRPSAALPDAGPSDAGAAARLRCFELAGELYAASAECLDEAPVVPGPITALSLVPHYVKGVMVRENRLAPIIDLAQRIARQPAVPLSGMVAGEINGTRFGFLVDRDGETVATTDVPIQDLPPIISLPWMRSAAVKEGQVIPLIDLALLLSGRSGEELPALHERYNPDSPFGNLFINQDVDLLEFSLLGARHALPRSEVKDILGIKRFRSMPDAPEIVIGSAEHNGEVLPVLDLAAIFGGRSAWTADWRMLLVENGDFHALVVTESVFEERRLSRENQRRLPISLPHQVVYGCYTDSDSVRLVLNVEAVAVHFERSLLSRFLPAASRETREALPEIARSLVDQKAVEAEAAPVAPDSSWEAVPSSEEEQTPAAGDRTPAVTEQREEQQEPEQETGEESVQERIVPAPEVEPAAMDHATGDAERLPEQERAAAPAQTEEAPSPAPVSASQEEPEDRGPASEEPASLADAMPRAAGEAAGPAPSEVEREETKAEPEALSEEQARPEPSSAFSDADTLRHSAQEQGSKEDRAAPAPAMPFAASSEEREGASPVRERIAPPAPDQGPTGSGPGERSSKAASPWRGPLAAMLAGVLAVLVVIGVLSRKAEHEQPAPVVSSVPAGSTAAGLPGKGEARKPSLVLDVPASMPVQTEVYVVKKGDTLWSISERFTGNPFNYPRIAGENRLANPDLIFPGQKIRLVMKSAGRGERGAPAPAARRENSGRER